MMTTDEEGALLRLERMTRALVKVLPVLEHSDKLKHTVPWRQMTEVSRALKRLDDVRGALKRLRLSPSRLRDPGSQLG